MICLYILIFNSIFLIHLNQMMIRNYKYRIKTLEEFKNEFGERWRTEINYFVTFPISMDFLLGTDIIDNCGKYNTLDESERIEHRHFSILPGMVKKIILNPNYNKKLLKY